MNARRRAPLWLVLVCLWGRYGWAEPRDGHASRASICLIAPVSDSELLQDALHRIVAELHAADFVVERVLPPGASDDGAGSWSLRCRPASGYLLLRPSVTSLSILATARVGDTPVQQEVQLDDRATTAEVVAIRAVEGLRAAMIQAMRSDDRSASPSPSVRRFTRFGDGAPARGPESVEATRDRDAGPASRDAGERTAPPRFPKALLALGTGVGVDGAQPAMPAELSASWRLHDLAFGAIIDASVLPAAWGAPSGNLRLRQYSLLGRVAWRAPCGTVVECELGVDAGWRLVSLEASRPGETASEQHGSALVSGEAFGGTFFEPHWGLGARARVGALLDAPDITLRERETLWGRPTITATLLLLARY